MWMDVVDYRYDGWRQLLSSISGIVVFVGRCRGNRAENTVNTVGVSHL
jgi:hypothetical protein